MNRKLTMRSLMNLLGVMIFLGMIIMAMTNPMTIDPNLGFHQYEGAIMTQKKLFKFSIFLLISVFIYFLLVYLYFLGPKRRALFFTILSILAIAAPVVAIILER
ncbi:hypothetical protein AB685_03110 [Bacillus sp. LL01]|uniref:hypothetical protein n=1 Tax=Bacillus sp. LL01 TaxID=1665556 RepID=UPI00064CFB5C|nr:hypothetical protein [Bacillus sp. LL01]KMJ59859.1 hypothetical protein AB685_03110 [Bacillus sp. LL01]